MGSLWGHLHEAIVFFFVGMWWMFNILKDYIRGGRKSHFVPRISYPANICGRVIPIEIYLKIFFSIAGALPELFDSGTLAFTDEKGNFIKMNNLHHVTIYCLFLTHSVLDLLRYRRVLNIDGLVHLTIVFAFMWYGAVFFFHSQQYAERLEVIVHIMGLVWCWGTGLSLLWEYRAEDKFMPAFCRSLAIFSLGTWFLNTPFFLFSSSSFPGENRNPRWEGNNPENYQFVAALFAFHLCINTILSVVMYAILRRIYNPSSILKTTKFRRIPDEKMELLDETSDTMSAEEL